MATSVLASSQNAHTHTNTVLPCSCLPVMFVVVLLCFCTHFATWIKRPQAEKPYQRDAFSLDLSMGPSLEHVSKIVWVYNHNSLEEHRKSM